MTDYHLWERISVNPGGVLFPRTDDWRCRRCGLELLMCRERPPPRRADSAGMSCGERMVALVMGS